LVAESIENADDVLGIITLNFSGETEKIFSRIKNDIPVILLQHAFANYTKSISYFDILDDYHLIKHKIAVWGDIVKNYLIHVKAIPENKIIVSGSPKYDSYSRIEKNKKSQWGMGGPGHTIKAEFSSRSHLEGIVSMARATDPDSAGSQFFIVTSDNNTEALDRQYTVFGKVTEGMDVAHKIENLPRDGNDCPKQEAKMLEVTISE